MKKYSRQWFRKDENIANFEQLWDPEQFNWKNSFLLCEYVPHRFDLWWDDEHFDWQSSASIARHCSDELDKWWNEDNFDWNYCSYLIKFCEYHFDTWWNPKKFKTISNKKIAIRYFANYCSSKYEVFFKPVVVRWVSRNRKLMDWMKTQRELQKYYGSVQRIYEEFKKIKIAADIGAGLGATQGDV